MPTQSTRPAPESASQRVHVHRPASSDHEACDDGDCPAKARDGRRCRGRRYITWFTDWYGWYRTCYHCGAMWGCGEYIGRADPVGARSKFHAWRGAADS